MLHLHFDKLNVMLTLTCLKLMRPPNEGHDSEFKVFFAADDQVIKVVLCSDVNYAHTLLR